MNLGEKCASQYVCNRRCEEEMEVRGGSEELRDAIAMRVDKCEAA